jgi:hypothetical protein
MTKARFTAQKVELPPEALEKGLVVTHAEWNRLMRMIRESSSGTTWCKDVALVMVGFAGSAGIAALTGYRSDLFTSGNAYPLFQECLFTLVFLTCVLVAFVCIPLARHEQKRHKEHKEAITELMQAIAARQPHEDDSAPPAVPSPQLATPPPSPSDASKVQTAP